jgi:hypothetical protein
MIGPTTAPGYVGRDPSDDEGTLELTGSSGKTAARMKLMD